MSVGPLVVEVCLVFFTAAFLLHRYGNYRKQHVLVTFGTLLAWTVAMLIVFILPLDVSETLYRQCLSDAKSGKRTSNQSTVFPDSASKNDNSTSDALVAGQQSSLGVGMVTAAGVGDSVSCIEPWTRVPDGLLPVLWRVVYWSSQALTWLILPFMQSYSNSGEFTVLGKLKAVLIANAIYYGTYLILFCICLIYVATLPISLDAESLKIICVTASNTWGLFLLVLLLGYGLVDVPRSLWWASRRGHSLQRAYFKLAKLSLEKSEAQEKHDDALQEVKRVAEGVRYNSPLRKYVDTILQKCPDEFKKKLRHNDDFVDYAGSDGAQRGEAAPTVKLLVALHKSIIATARNSQRACRQWSTLVEQTSELEDVAANEASNERCYRCLAGTKYSGCLKLLHSPRLEWYWKCRLRRILLAAVACILLAFSAMVAWSECVFFVEQPVLSLFAIFVNASQTWHEYFVIEVISIAVIAYLCVCAYSTVFKIRVFNYIYIAPHHQTDEYSLLFSGMFLCRLTPPLCLNFLGLIHLDNHITKGGSAETAYTHIMGHMDVIKFIASGFNIYFPIAIVVLCAATALRLGARCLHCIGVQQFIGNDDDVTQELVDEGKNLMKLERRRIERDNNRDARRREAQALGVGGSTDNDLSTTAAPSLSAVQRLRPVPNNTESSLQAKLYGSSSSMARLSGGGTRRSAIDEDRVDLLSDQDFMDFVPGDEAEASKRSPPSLQTKGYGQPSSQSKQQLSGLPSRRLFDDV